MQRDMVTVAVEEYPQRNKGGCLKLSFDWQPVECFELWSNMFMSALAKRNFQCKVLITASVSEQRFTVVQPTENKRMHQLSSGFHH